MPLTFPSHPAAVLPLKLWRPTWFDGVALVIGSMAPDFAYVLDGSGLPVWPFSHQLAGLVGWCLPITLIATWLVRLAAPVIAVHLPPGGGLALRDYGAIGTGAIGTGAIGYGAVGRARHRWWVTVTSALVGAASHLALDWVELRVPYAEYVMHVLGLVGMVAILLYIGRRRLVRQWHGDPPARATRPALFWTVAGVVALPAIAITPLLPGAFLAHTTGARLLCSVGAGLLAAAAAVALVPVPSRSSR